MLAFIIVLSVLIIVCLTAAVYLNRPKETRDSILTLYTWGVVLVLGFTALFITCDLAGTYKEGQVDALNGKFKYERQFVIPEGDSTIVDTLYIAI
jgi:hypothetical protein